MEEDGELRDEVKTIINGILPTIRQLVA